MTQKTALIRLKLVSALGAIGFGISAYQSHQYYQIRNGAGGFASFCNINELMNCNAVMASRFAELFGGLPLSSLAACAYVAMVILVGLAHLDDARKDSIRGLQLLSSVGLLFSVGYLAIMVFVLKTFCLLCLSLDLVNVLIFALAWSLKKEGDGGSLKSALMVTAASAILLPALALLEGQIEEARYTDEELIAAWLPREAGADIMGPTPELQSIGPSDAPVTIVEFSDLQCPHCRKGANILGALKDRFPGKVRIVMRHFPLDAACNSLVQPGQGHTAACEAAQAVYCAAQQKQFEGAYQTLFDQQESIAPGKIAALLSKLPLDQSALQACMTSETTLMAIKRDIQDGIVLKVQSTPTIYVNKHWIDGVYPLRTMTKFVETLLAQKK